ncbi:DUF6518 family protein [Cellulomonas telluris]|uniref:DUF6518 family protein n=1 Tax=Cellulomonas telluris TaxID=2306636 RepID=UPI0010A831F1|nr:DUF6518 family protein [Cellulomonas telluris]
MTTSALAPARPAVPSATRGAAHGALAVVAGLASGGLTSFAQTYLTLPGVAALANAVSPWLVLPFLAGATARSRRGGALLGLLACLAQVPGYYATASLRGYPVSLPWVLVWAVLGVVGGAVAGLAGQSWWRGRGRERGLGAAVLVAVWLAEAVVQYGVVLRYTAEAVTFGVVGALAFALLGLRHRQHVLVLTWLGPALLAGAGGFLGLHAVA